MAVIFECSAFYGDWIDPILAIPPSCELVPLIRLINPDFVFFQGPGQRLKPLISWLKVFHARTDVAKIFSSASRMFNPYPTI